MYIVAFLAFLLIPGSILVHGLMQHPSSHNVPTATVETIVVTPEPTVEPTVEILSYRDRKHYIITLNAPITLTGNRITGEIECSNEYGTITVVGSYDGTRPSTGDVHGSRGLPYNGIPYIASTIEITDTIDRCWGIGTWR